MQHSSLSKIVSTRALMNPYSEKHLALVEENLRYLDSLHLLSATRMSETFIFPVAIIFCRRKYAITAVSSSATDFYRHSNSWTDP